MTIPIRPGPWSFLATAGQGVGDYIKNKADFEKNDRAEATKMLEFLFKAASGPDKTIKSDALVGPTAQALMKRAGIGQLFQNNLAPQPEEALAQGRTDALGELMPQILQGGSQYAKTQLAQGKIATPEESKRSDLRATALSETDPTTGQPTAGARALAQTPSPATATAQDQSAQNPELSGIALRVVRDAYVRNGNKIPDLATIKAALGKDLRAKPFVAELTDAFLGNAVRDLQAELAEEETKRVAAETRRSANAQNVVKDITSQQSELRQRMQDRSTENKNLESSLSALTKLAQLPGGDPANIAETDKQNLAKIAANNAANAADQATLTGLTQQAGQVIAPRVTKSGGQPEGTLAQRRLEWDRRSKAIKDRPNDPRVKGKTVEQLIGPRP